MADQIDKQIDAILGPDGSYSIAPQTKRDPIESQIDQLLGTLTTAPTTGQQQYVSVKPQEEEGWWRAAGLARNALFGGLATAAGKPGDVAAMLGGTEGAGDLLRDPTAAAYGYGPLPTTADMQALAGRAGLLNNTSLTVGAGSYPNLERYGTAALSGVASAAPLMAYGAGPMVLAQGLAGGLAGEGARQIDPSSPYGPAVAGALAGGLVQGGRNLLAGDPLKNAARSLGVSETPDQAGSFLQAALKDWRSNEMNIDIAGNKMNTAAAPLDAGIPAEASKPATALMDNINNLLDAGGHKANAIKGFLNSTQNSGGFLGSIAKKFNDSLAEASLSNTEPVPPDLSWAEGRALRTEIGTALGTARPADKPALKVAYSGVTDHLGQIANEHDLGDEFQSFNKVSTDMHNLNEGVVEDILSARDSGTAFTRALVGSNRSGETIQSLRNEAPQAVDELASAVLNYVPQQWKKMSPEAKEALIPDGVTRRVVDARTGAPASTSALAKGIGHISGMQLGDLLGMAVASKLGVNPLEAGAYGGLGLGYLLPTVGTVAKSLVRPSNLAAKAVGAVGGETRVPQEVSP